jgi:hypothetical protein
MNITNNVLIFSGESNNVSAEKNAIRTKEIESALKNAYLDYKKVIGSYKGIKENSFVVLDTDKTRQVVKDLCEVYNQQSFMGIDSNRQAYLVYMSSGRTEELGRFKAVSESEALKSEAWTYDPTTKTYYKA